MFFGKNLNPEESITFCPPKSVHITGVALCNGDIAKIYLVHQKHKFIMATLSQNVPQALVDYEFYKGENVSLLVKGNGVVSMYGSWEDTINENFPRDTEKQNTKGMKARANLKDFGNFVDEEEEYEDDDDIRLIEEYKSYVKLLERDDKEEDSDSNDEDDKEEDSDSNDEDDKEEDSDSNDEDDKEEDSDSNDEEKLSTGTTAQA